MLIGTNDAYSLILETANTAAITIDSSQLIQFNAYDCTSFANGGALTADASGNITCTDDDGGGGGGSLFTDGGAATYLTATGDTLLVGASTANGGKLEVVSTTEQFRLSYDASNNTTFTVGSSGDLTVTPSGGQLSLAGDLEVTSGNYISLAGGNTASRPGSPTEGMVYFDTTTDSLLTYANGKWQSDRGEYVVVAANDSSQAAKDRADYVGDGESGDGLTTLDGDQVQLNAAVSAVNATGGGTVFLMEGTYVLDDEVSLLANVRIIGSGQGTILTFPNGLSSGTSLRLLEDKTASVTGVEVRNLKLDGNGANVSASVSHTGIYFNDGTATNFGIKIDNITAIDFDNYGVHLAGGDNNFVTNSTFDGEDVSTSNSGIYSFASYSTISGNTISRFALGISESTTESYNIITNNIITDLTGGSYSAIESGGDYSVVSDNVISLNTNADGIVVNGANQSINGNTITGGDYGINTVNAATTTISSNTINGSIDGIFINNNDRGSITGNVISNTTDNGIEIVGGSDDWTVTGNEINNSAGYGIYLGNSNINRTVVSNNNLYNNGGGATRSSIIIGASGAASDTNVTGNRITDTAGSGYAIDVTSFATNTYLSGNIFSGTGATTINDAGTNTIFANQATTAGGLNTTFRQSNSTTAFSVQNASGASILNVDTTNAELEVGNTTTAGRLVLSDGSSNTATILVASTAGDYTYTIPTTTANDTFCLVGLNNCTGAGVTTLAAIGSSPNANGATISSSTLTLQPASASFGGVVTTGTQTFAGAKTFNDGITSYDGLLVEQTGFSYVQTYDAGGGGGNDISLEVRSNSSYAFNVKDASGVNAFTVDATLGTITVGDASGSMAGNISISDGSNNYGTIRVQSTAGNYTYTIPTTTANDTFCLLTLNNCPGNSKFTDGGTQTYLTATTDELVVGGSASLGAKLAIVGTSDQEQLLIRANATQSSTNPLVLFQSSAGTDIFSISSNGNQNSFVGLNAGRAISSGAWNTLVGAYSGENLTTGGYNTTLGAYSLQNATGSDNTAIGSSSGSNIGSGTYNTLIGSDSGKLLSGASSNNVVIGGGDFATGAVVSNNTIVGRTAGLSIDTGGNNNILLGYGAGSNITTGANNIILGYSLNASSATVSNELRIGGILQGSTSTLAAQFNGALTVAGNLAVDTNTLFVDAANNRVGIGTSTFNAGGFDLRVGDGTGDVYIDLSPGASGISAICFDNGACGNGIDFDNVNDDLDLYANGGVIKLNFAGASVTGGLNVSALATFDANLRISDGSSNYGTIAVQSTAGNYTYTIPTTTANDTFCLVTLNNCAGTASTLQASYTADVDGSDAEILLTAADGALRIRDAASTVGNLFVVEANGGSDYFAVASSGITLGINTTLAANQSLTITGGNTASRPGSPTEGMVYFDTSTDSLLTYANGKWQSDRGEYVVVAANDSTQAEKDSADYVADGTADQTEINNALTEASGGKVILLAGTYVANATILIPNNTTLAGTGPGTVIELADIDATDNLIETSGASKTGQIIRDLTLDGQDSLNTVGTQYAVYFVSVGSGNGSGARQGGSVINTYIKDFRTSGFYSNASDNNNIVNNVFQGNGGSGIYIPGSTENTLISGNRFIGNGGDGLEIVGGSKNTITSNVFEGNGGSGLYYNTGTYVTISGNTSNDNSSRGLYLYNLDDSTVSGNTANSNTSRGLEIFSTDTTVTGNTFNGNASNGIYALTVNTTSFTGNTIQNNTSAGIFFNGGGDDNIVSGNTVSGNSSGIYLTSADRNTISSNNIYDNGGSTTNNGIYLDNSNYNSIVNNTISDSACTTNCYAINLALNTPDKNYLEGNRFTGSTANAASINDTGTNTIYSGQQTNTTTSTASDVSDFRFRGSADSTTAFSVQNASGASILNVDTTNGELELGTSAAAGRLVLSDGSSNTGTILVASTAGDYTFTIPTVTANDTFCLVGLNNCTGAGVTTLAAIGSSPNANGATISSSTLTLQPASASFGGVVTTGTQTFAGAKTFNSSVSSPGAGSSSERFGSGATAAGQESVALGNQASSGGFRGVAIGYLTSTSANDSIAIGGAASASVSQSVAIGSGASASTWGDATAIGFSSTVSGLQGTAVGAFSSAAGNFASSLGRSASAAGEYSVAIGSYSSAAFTSSIALGSSASTTASNQFVLGSTSASINQGYFGNGVTASSPTAFTINATGGSGTDIAGGNLSLAGGRGTGSAAGGSLLFQTSAAGISGTTLRSLSTVLTLAGGTGAATFQNTSNSTTAFAVRNASSTNLLSVDTSNNITYLDGSNTLIFGNTNDCNNNTCLGAGFLTGAFGLNLNATNTSGINFAANNGTFTFDNTGGATSTITTATNETLVVAPNGTGDIQYNLDDGTNFQLSGVRTNTGASQSLAVTLGNDAGVDTVSALQVSVTSAATGDADILQAIDISNLASANATVVENAINLGTGWDSLLTYNTSTTLINGTGQWNLAQVTGTLAVANGGTGATTSQGAINAISQLTTEGDILYNNGTNSTRLARGADGQCLISNTTTILWGSCGAAGLSAALADNTANAWDIQEGTNNYININTTNASENISFGNATTNPSYNFLGTGALSVAGSTNLSGSLRLQGSTMTTYSPPGGGTFNTRISLESVTYGANEAGLNIILASGSDAGSRGISVFDDRNTTNNTPAIAVFSPDENQILGLGWDGQNNYGYIKSTLGVGIKSGANVLFEFGTAYAESYRPLVFTGTGTVTYTTPQSSPVPTKIGIATYNPGNFGQVLALGIDNTALSTSRVISLFDNRSAGDNQPALSLFTPDESDQIGFNTDGSNAYGYVKATSGIGIGIKIGSTVAAQFETTGAASFNNTLTVTGATTINNRLTVSGTAPNGTGSSIASIGGTVASTGADQMSGLLVNPNITVSTSSDIFIGGALFAPTSSTNNLDTGLAALVGAAALPTYSGTGTLANLVGLGAQYYNASTGTVAYGIGIKVQDGLNPFGTIDSSLGVYIENQTAGTDNTNLYIGDTGTIPIGNYSIYSQSTYGSLFAGALTVDAQITSGDAGTAGSLRISDGSSNYGTIAVASTAGNYTYTIPTTTANDEFCLATLGNCFGAGSGGTLQAAYNASTNPEIVVDATRGALTVRDNATPIAANLLEVQNNAGTTTYFAVSNNEVTLDASTTLSFGGNVDISGGSNWLDFDGASTSGTYFGFYGSQTAATGTNVQIELGGQATGGDLLFKTYRAGAPRIYSFYTGSAAEGSLQIDSDALSNGLLLQTNSGGNVGIGALIPTSRLQVDSTVTNNGSTQSINTTLGNDGNVDTIAAFKVNVTSAATGDADVLKGIDIETLASANGTVIERALQIGSGWDANIFLNDTTTQVQVVNAGVITFEDDAGNDLLVVTDGGTVGNIGITGTLAVANITPTANLTIGTSDTTGSLLILDTKTNAGDPTGVAGGMYYNSSLGKIRCFEGGVWKNCVATSLGVTTTVTRIPEFEGGTIYADGTSNSGTLTSGYASGLSGAEGYKHNYYQWSTSQATAQDYNIVVQVPIPSDFTGSFSSISFWHSDPDGATTNSEITLTITDQDGTSCSSATYNGASAGVWEQETVSVSTCTYSPDDILTFDFRIKTTSGAGNLRLGEFKYQYVN
jgi:parallel beta-helix repeat protein